MSKCSNDTAEKAETVAHFEEFVKEDKYFNGFSDMRYGNGMQPNRTYVDMAMELAYRSYVAGAKRVALIAIEAMKPDVVIDPASDKELNRIAT